MENRVEQRSEIVGYVQSNPAEFGDRRMLPDVAIPPVQRKGWRSGWRYHLTLYRDPKQHSDADMQVATPFGVRSSKGRWFHIEVRNSHPKKPAINCYTYLKRLTCINTKTVIPLEANEFYRAGCVLLSAQIDPYESRYFDSFYVLHDEPYVPLFPMFSDSTKHYPRVCGPGQYEMTYEVVSDNLPPSEKTFIATFSTRLDGTTLIEKG